MITLILFTSAAVLELLVHLFGRAKRFRKILAAFAMSAVAFTGGVMIAVDPNLFSVMLALLGLYRALNMIRIIESRMHDVYLRRSTLRTSLVLIAVQLVILAGWLLWTQWHATGHGVWAVVGGIQAVSATILLLSIRRNLIKTAWPAGERHYTDKELPTVTLALPARNETEDLQRCLESAIASDYPKLEIIVLDDCSQVKRTPEIIRSFAQAGVRFVQGHAPNDTWLPKNRAYDRLTQEASGEYILFCGVDIRFQKSSIRTLVTTMLDRHKQMICVMPHREKSTYSQLSLIQAMRYWWELAPPRRLFKRPAVLSSSWIITRDALVRSGGFAAIARAIVPEAHFARELIKTDAYSFLRASDGLGITSNKSVDDQRSTAIRMRYPQLHRRPEQVALFSLLEIIFLLAPFLLAVLGFWVSIGVAAHVLAAVACLLLTSTYLLATRSTHVNAWWFALIGQPFAVLTDLFLVHYSMYKYEFSTVDWKGRNVCIPAMHVVPRLPKAD